MSKKKKKPLNLEEAINQHPSQTQKGIETPSNSDSPPKNQPEDSTTTTNSAPPSDPQATSPMNPEEAALISGALREHNLKKEIVDADYPTSPPEPDQSPAPQPTSPGESAQITDPPQTEPTYTPASPETTPPKVKSRQDEAGTKIQLDAESYRDKIAPDDDLIFIPHEDNFKDLLAYLQSDEFTEATAGHYLRMVFSRTNGMPLPSSWDLPPSRANSAGEYTTRYIYQWIRSEKNLFRMWNPLCTVMGSNLGNRQWTVSVLIEMVLHRVLPEIKVRLCS